MADFTFVSQNSVFSPDVDLESAFGFVKVVQEDVIVHGSFVHNINTRLVRVTTANGGTVTQASSNAVLQSSAAVNGSAILETLDVGKYVPGQGLRARFTAVFSTPRANSLQRVGLFGGTSLNGFAFGFLNDTFGIFYIRANNVDFFPQAEWNINPAPFTGFDPLFGNVYEFAVQYLGYGPITAYIGNKTTLHRIPVHRIEYPSTALIPSVENPSFPLRAQVANTGNNTNLIVRVGSWAAIYEGHENRYGLLGSSVNRKANLSGGVNLVTLRNNTTFTSIENRVAIRILGFGASVEGTADGQFALIRGATLGGAPSFTDFDTNTSCAAIDTAGTTATGGTTEFAMPLSGPGSVFVPLEDYRILLRPGETFTVKGTSVAGTPPGQGSIFWREEMP